MFAAPAYDWRAVTMPTEDPPGWFARMLQWVGGIIRNILEWSRGAEAAGVPVTLILSLVAVVILIHAAYSFAREARRAGQEGSTAGIPRSPQRNEAWYWGRAVALAGEGRYSAAMLAAFHAATLRLESRGALRPRPGATPRELARAATLSPAERARLESLVLALYGVAFAAEPMDAAAFADWLGALRGIVDARAH